MAFQWLQMRITEEQDRREREARILSRLPSAMEEVFASLEECVRAYASAFGQDSADARLLAGKIRVTVREQKDGKWQPAGKVDVVPVPTLPGFQVEHGEERIAVEVGILAGDKIFYKMQEHYLGIEQVTRLILDRALFPKLGE